MKVSKGQFDRAASGVVSAEQAEALWGALVQEAGGRPRFDLPNVAYYFGALVVISAMGWFVSDAWERFGGWGIFSIALAYGAAFVAVGLVLRRRGLRVPGGLLATLAVCMVPLAVYGLQRATGLWVGADPGEYEGFFDWIRGGWFVMEAATIAAALVALVFFRFPFLTAPLAFSLWFMSMDITPLLFGADVYDPNLVQKVSLFFGLAVLVVSYLADLLLGAEEDYAFWGYLFGTFAFWGGLSALEGGTELDWFLYGAINVGLILLSVLLQRRAFVVFGALGVFAYTAHLANELFADSVLFPFVLSAAGLAVIALGILYAKNRERIERAAQRLIPQSARRFLPNAR